MKCYYKVLEVESDSNIDVIKKSYRRLALKWHPDKNLNNSEEAKEEFQLIQQAYEVLSDPQERSWYDKHKDSILRGGLDKDYKDESLNVYGYFSNSCYKGYNDDVQGFYAVYREVFNKIATEDLEFETNDDSDCDIPDFGDSTSSYEDIQPFYNYWLSYSTKKTYSWLGEYDTHNVHRKISRIMEKENKKVRDKAKKERNEEVRSLCQFVRKRDRRVIEYFKLVEQQTKERELKLLQLDKKRVLEKKESMSQYVESDWVKSDAHLLEMENYMGAEEEQEEELTDFYCSACNKVFRSNNAFTSHENSKKHKENLRRLIDFAKEEFKEELENVDNTEEIGQNVLTSCDEETIKKVKKKKQKQKKEYLSDDKYCSDLEIEIDSLTLNKNESQSSPGEDSSAIKKTTPKPQKSKKKTEPKISSIPQNQIIQCSFCKEVFQSKNELFKHLRSTGHAVPIPDKNVKTTNKTRNKR